MRTKAIFFVTLFFVALSGRQTANAQRTLTYEEYIARVRDCNIGYLAEKYNVSIAQANATAARVFPDPELSVGYGNNQNWNLQMGYGYDASLSWTLELGGKRKARIRVARSEQEMTVALLEDYFRNLRADATIAYLGALKQKRECEIQRSSYEQMLGLARADSVRFSLGSIAEVDARQSKLEAAAMLGDVYASEGDLKDALVQLSLLQGSDPGEISVIAGELKYVRLEFDLAALIASAQNNRADLQAALRAKELSQNNLRLARANRAIDLGLSAGGSYSSEVRNELAPAPAFKGITAGVSIPLKFSNTNKGELKAAQLALEQSETQYRAVEMQIASEVAQAYNQYTVARRRAEQFDTGMLSEAETIFKKRAYSYERGETGILELLNAQRTYNDMQLSRNETLYDCAAALVELERACGVTMGGMAPR